MKSSSKAEEKKERWAKQMNPVNSNTVVWFPALFQPGFTSFKLLQHCAKVMSLSTKQSVLLLI